MKKLLVLTFLLLATPAVAQQTTATVGCVAGTASVLGCVKPDGTTITNTAGAVSVTYGTGSNTAVQGNDTRIPPSASSTWTPTDASGAGVGVSCATTCRYVRIGPLVYIYGDIAIAANASATQVQIGGLPTVALAVPTPGSWIMSDVVAAGDTALVGSAATNFKVYNSAGVARAYSTLASQIIYFSGFYAVN